MGFPQWTLWGMVLSALGALIFLTIALLGQSPGVASRFGLSGARLLSRVRLFTGYAYACLLLAIGFFAAGVPLNQGEAVAVTATSPTTEVALPTRTESTQEAVAEVNDSNDTPPATPVTGAFSGPPTGNEADTPVGESITPPISPTLSLTDEPAGPGAGTTTSQPAATPTPRPTQTATSTPSPTATPTLFPTVTPTPIVSPTAIVNAAGSSIWLVRSPGGQQLLILSDGDTIIPLTGHASQGGFMWREVMTVNGVVGWLPAEFVDTGS